MTDWLMVIITFIYVVATIVICIFNGKSAKESKEQIEESKRQYEETKRRYETTERIKVMPYLVLENVKPGNRQNMMTFTLSIKNCGYGSVVDFYIFTEDLDSKSLPVVYKNTIPYVLSSPVEKHYLQMCETSNFEILRDQLNVPPKYAERIEIKLKFKDMFDNKYEQNIYFEYMGYDVGRTETFSPKLMEHEEEL